MSIKPILFNTEMVSRLQDGTKTVTRRPIKPRYCDSVFEMFRGQLCESSPYKPPRDNGDGTTTHFVRTYVPCKAPHRPGDILYVRETWAAWSRVYGVAPTLYYKADGDAPGSIKWRPSIHMPREAARIFLRVTDVRVERLQDITEEQARAEGAKDPYDYQKPEWYDMRPYLLDKYDVAAFAGLWNSTIKPAARALYGWDANPWVWVIEFERISKEEAMQYG